MKITLRKYLSVYYFIDYTINNDKTLTKNELRISDGTYDDWTPTPDTVKHYNDILTLRELVLDLEKILFK